MGFSVSVPDLEAFVSSERASAVAWVDAADQVQASVEELMALDSMQGAAADAVRSRMAATVLPMVQSARLLAGEYDTQLLLYQDSIHRIEGAAGARLVEGEMSSLESAARTRSSQASDAAEAVRAAAASVSDLVSPPIPDAGELLGSLADAEARARSSREDVGTAESSAAAAASEVDGLVSALDAYVVRVERSVARGFSVADVLGGPEAAALVSEFDASLARLQAASSSVDEACAREQAYFERRSEEEAARAREAQGWGQVVTGVLAGVVGIGAIVLTAGAATPIVVGAAFAGGASLAYGASEIWEGSQNVSLGRAGDIESLAFNPLRDTIFGGDQESYDLFGRVSMFAAGTFMAGGAAAHAAAGSGAGLGGQLQQFGRAAALGAVDDAVGDQAGAAVTAVASRFMGTGEASALGFVASMVVGGPSANDLDGIARRADDLGDLGRRADDFAADVRRIDGAAATHAGGRLSSCVAGSADDVITDGSQWVDAAARRSPGKQLKPNVTYRTGEHDYLYRTNADGNISEVHAEQLRRKVHVGRLSHDSRTFDKLSTDDAGHLIADRFGGSPDVDNIVSQDWHLNQRTYKALEDRWDEAIDQGKQVSVDIRLEYEAPGRRPSAFVVIESIDGEVNYHRFSNTPTPRPGRGGAS